MLRAAPSVARRRERRAAPLSRRTPAPTGSGRGAAGTADAGDAADAVGSAGDSADAAAPRRGGISRALPLGLVLVIAASALALGPAWRALGLAPWYWLLRLALALGWVLVAVGAIRQVRRGGVWRSSALPAVAVATAILVPAGITRLAVRHLETRVVEVAGMERTYHLYAPGPDRETLPLVVVMHGFLQSWRSARRMTGFEELAERQRFFVAWPEGHRWSWNDGDPRKPAVRRGADDLAFLRTLVEDVSRSHPVDRERVYAVGFSNSAFLIALRACDLSDRYAAVGVVAGGVTPEWPETCADSRPMPAIFINGTEDPALAPLGGDAPELIRSAELWAERNGCRYFFAEPLPNREDDGTRVRRTRYSGCRSGSGVTDYRIVGGGHAWPGGPQYFPRSMIGRTSRDLDATEAIWRFLRRNWLPAGLRPRRPPDRRTA